MIKLKTLNLSSNRFYQSFPDSTFERLVASFQHTLNRLILQHNKLRNFKWTSKSNHQEVEFIDLSFNQITTFEIESTRTIGSTAVFNLTNNSIKKLEIKVMEHHLHFNDKYTFLLDDNPFFCDCQMHNMLDDNEEKKNQIMFEYGSAKCIGPYQIKGKSMKSLETVDLMCEIDYHISNCSYFYRKKDKSVHVDCKEKVVGDFASTINNHVATMKADTQTKTNFHQIRLDFKQQFFITAFKNRNKFSYESD